MIGMWYFVEKTCHNISKHSLRRVEHASRRPFPARCAGRGRRRPQTDGPGASHLPRQTVPQKGRHRTGVGGGVHVVAHGVARPRNGH